MECYHTVYTEGTGEIVEKKSRFIAEVFPVSNEEEAFAHLEEIRKRNWDARHHCWAYVIGRNPAAERMSDDGEPAGTAGKPILGQMLSNEITDCLIVVVRYFGGTKLGVPGLISAYKESAAAVIEAANVVERTVDTHFKIEFSYIVMNDVMRIIKEEQPTIVEQIFDNLCEMHLSIRKSRADIVEGRLRKVEGAIVEVIE